MGGIATAVIGAVIGGAAQSLFAPKSSAPSSPAPAPTADPAATRRAATGAADQQRKRAMGATGRSDTILTGPQGLGSVGEDNGQQKNLLGY